MIVELIIPCYLLSMTTPDCFHADPVTSELAGTLSINTMNQSQALTGMLDGNTNEMVVWNNGEVVTRVSTFYESYGVLINDNGIAAGLGSYGISQDDRLIIANQNGEFEIAATIFGSAGWSSLTAINENGSVAGNYSGGSGSSDWQAFIWTESNGLQFIEPTAETTYATAIDKQNKIAGQIKIENSYHAMIWDNGEIFDIAANFKLKGNSAARYFDATGRVLIYEFSDGAPSYYWYNPSDTSLTVIYRFPVGSYTMRAVASQNGNIAFSWSSSELGPQLARWSDETGFELATIDEAIVGISAMSINSEGTVACSAFILPVYESIAMLWKETPIIHSLHEQVPNTPFSTQVVSMNEHGDVLIKADSLFWILTETCESDLNDDGTVGVADLLFLLSAWGDTGIEPCGADLDGSNVIDVGDVLVVIDTWGACE